MTSHIVQDLREERLVKLVEKLAMDFKALKEESEQTKLLFERRLQAERARHKCELELSQRERDELTLKLEKATQELESLKKQLFSGWGSEKKPSVELNATQLWLDGFGTNIPLEALPPETPEKEIKAHKRAGPRRGSKDGESRFSDEAQIVEIEICNPFVEGIPEDELVVTEIQEFPRITSLKSKFVVVRVVQKGYRRKREPKEEFPPLALPEVIPGSLFDVSSLVAMVIDKYRWHQPLYRQHQKLKASGIFVDRGNLSRVVHKVGELLSPVYDCLKDSVLASSVLAADETPTPVHLGGKMSKGYFWVFYGESDEVCFHFATSKKKAVISELLADFEGHLVTDGYSAYSSFVARMEALKEVYHVCCWSHTRRKFLAAEKKHPDEFSFIIKMIQALYQVEERVRGKPTIMVFRARQSESKLLVEKLFAYLKRLQVEGTFTASDPLLKAVNYALKRRNALSEFLGNAQLPMDTNHLERQLRSQAIGRKNWMFHMTESGAEHAAVFYSLIQSCLLAQVNPTVYLTDVLLRIIDGENPAILVPRVWSKGLSNEAMCSVLVPTLGYVCKRSITLR